MDDHLHQIGAGFQPDVGLAGGAIHDEHPEVQNLADEVDAHEVDGDVGDAGEQQQIEVPAVPADAVPAFNGDAPADLDVVQGVADCDARRARILTYIQRMTWMQRL